MQFQRDSFAGQWQQRISRQPGWVTRWALLAAAVVLLLPIVLLMLFAMLIGVAVFYTLAIFVRLRAALHRRFGSKTPARPQYDDGRRNVRVIDDR